MTRYLRMLDEILPIFEFKTVVFGCGLLEIAQYSKVCNLLKEVCLPNIINN